ncbi:hypothetical protein LY474_33240 [Myxococcus stipitatus]|uniref:hypothetical protein n=1 Tax=Myxococcus stipitatus TaxID=83455 RepID=UPI001F44974D|nr:hypothetical protein [Myxococcus stipitatus]MCE9672685.1 hypothetical protein [Myxococcus stipitatus]
MKTPGQKRPFLAVVVVLSLGGPLLPRVASAEPPGSVQTYVLSATRLYNDLEYEGALEQISRAKRHSRSETDDALLSLYEGVILADLGRGPSSDAAFKAALFLQPDAKLPLTVSPKVSERFEQLRGQVKRELEAAAVRNRASAPPAVVVAPPATSTPEVRAGASRLERAWLPAAIGGGLLAGSGVTFLLARSQHSKLTDKDTDLETVPDVKDTSSKGKTYQTVGVVLAGAGVVGLGVAAGMYLWGAPSRSPETGLVLSTDGTSAFVSGRWP